jgi:type III pantothenate kinase
MDIGNSRVKWATAHGPELADHHRCVWRGRDLVETLADEFFADHAAEEIWICSVADADSEERLTYWLQQQWGVPVRFVRAESSRSGLVNAYADPGQMGADRWLAMLALWASTQASFLLVDCGTAVTVDVVDDQGRHIGGMIAPGLTSMRRSLYEQTARVTTAEDLLGGELGRDTAGCAAAGTLNAIIGLIERGLRCASEHLARRPVCLISGGDGELIHQHLDDQFEYDPHIVLKGLLAYAKSAS